METLKNTDGWQIDEKGRRYRNVGDGCVDYEREVTIGGFMVPESQAESVREQLHKQEAADAKRKLEAQKKANAMKLCPLNLMHKCHGARCAFYSEADGCMGAESTQGKRCPISNYMCNASCALYEGDGCRVLKIMKGA